MVLQKLKKKKIFNQKTKLRKFVLFCGSYSYWPNKIAVENIFRNKNIINKKFPNIKFIFTIERFSKIHR